MPYRLMIILSMMVTGLSTPVWAEGYQDGASPWSVFGRISGFFPDGTLEDVTIVSTGTPITISNDEDLFASTFSGEAGLNVFITDHFALETGFSFYRYTSVELDGTTSEEEAEDKLSFIPIMATLQFYPAPYGEVTPYIGGGFHYTFIDASNNADTAQTFADGASGLVFQAGFDWWSESGFAFNMDIKKLLLSSDTTLTAVAQDATGAILFTERAMGTVNIDPLIISAGIRYRF